MSLELEMGQLSSSCTPEDCPLRDIQRSALNKRQLVRALNQNLGNVLHEHQTKPDQLSKNKIVIDCRRITPDSAVCGTASFVFRNSRRTR